LQQVEVTLAPGMSAHYRRRLPRRTGAVAQPILGENRPRLTRRV